MRILLACNAQYFPAHGGGEKSNRMLMEALAARGHECLVLTRIERFGGEGKSKLLEELSSRGVQAKVEPESVRFTRNQVNVETATEVASFRAFFMQRKQEFRPTHVVTSTDDPAQLLLESALGDPYAVTTFLARATIALPFGPDAAFASRGKTDVLRQVDGIVGVSHYVADYIADHSGISATHVPIALPEPGPHPCVGHFDNEFVTLANPCAVKGISVFLALAQYFPELAFAGVPTWGTTEQDIAAMSAQPNITVLSKVDQITDLMRRTRVLLMPSLWAEARSRMAVDGMLAGVPVIASNLGGLPEAKMHVPYILPVNPIASYKQTLNEQMVPVAQVPEQNLEPWTAALDRLTTDRAHWKELSSLSRSTALQYAETTTIEPFEQFLMSLHRKPRITTTARRPAPSVQLAALSPEKRRLLESKLRTRASRATNPLCFCFPHAGGSGHFLKATVLQANLEPHPIHYRTPDGWPDSLEDLVQNLATQLAATPLEDSIFFGYSMGSIVAFELARVLEQAGRLGPRALIVAAARAPVFRRDHVPPPDPTRADLIGELRKLGGLPENLLDNPDDLDQVLPAVEADTRLFRRYIYKTSNKLAVPILALGGTHDPNVTEDHLRHWQGESAAGFQLRLFSGGHFFLRENEPAAAEAIRLFFNPART